MDNEQRDQHTDMKVCIGMLLLIIVPFTIALSTVKNPRPVDPLPVDPGPYGYTVSLLIFIVPCAALVWWFRRRPEHGIQKKAFWRAVLLFTACGMALDVLLASKFWYFPYARGHLGVHLPGFDWETHSFGAIVPVEELVFYFFGALFILLFYLWGSLFWFGTEIEGWEGKALRVQKVVSPHWSAGIWGGLVVLAGWFYKHQLDGGFPGYYAVLTGSFAVLTFILFRVVKAFIDWRALSMSVGFMWLMSLFWEVTLALGYGWWRYKPEAMLGIFVGPWWDLPIEEPLLWTVSSWGVVMFYTYFRIFLHKNAVKQEAGESQKHMATLFGEDSRFCRLF